MVEIKDKVLEDVVWVDPERMGGVACFKGTRVPIEALFHYCAADAFLDQFCEDFPTVEKLHLLALIDWAKAQACQEAGALETLA